MAFWGLVLEPKKKYSQTTVEQPFHVTMAALDLQNCDPNEDGSSVVLRRGDSDFILCSLSKKRGIYNVPLNLDFELGGEINFHILGSSTIHLTGCIIEDEMEGLDESDDSMEEEEVDEKPSNDLFKKTKKLLEESTKRKPDASPSNQAKKAKVEVAADEDEDEDDSDFDMEDDSDLGEEEEEEDSDDGEEDEEGDDSTPVPKKPQQAQAQLSGKKQKQAEKQAANLNNSVSKNAQQGKKDNKENKNEKAKVQNNQQNKPNGSQSQSNGPSKRMCEGGVMVEDVQTGSGPTAKRGKMVAVYYVGRLKNNNKQFDASTSGQGFKFRLGTGEVIKGWDTGIVGMKVGGKRRLTIPPKVAYGSKGAPPQIPPNSTLVFDVELRNVM